MSKLQFRCILFAYLILVALDFAPNSAAHSPIPDFVDKAQHSRVNAQLAAPEGSAASAFLDYLTFGVVGTASLSFISLFWFWKPGLHLFFATVALRIVTTSLLWRWYAQTSWGGFVGTLGTLLEGFIFALVYFGPAKKLFSENSRSRRYSESSDFISAACAPEPPSSSRESPGRSRK